MRTICFYFQVHQPFRLRRYRFFDIGENHYYYDDYANKAIMKKVAEKCYIPANEILLDQIQKHKGKFKVAFSISGLAIEQFEMFAPQVLESFKRLAKTGCVEFLAETYSHSLVSLHSKEGLVEQVNEHILAIKKHFGLTPKVFRNTELIYDDAIGATIAEMGFKAMLTEGAKHILGWKSPNFLYYNVRNPKLKLLLKNFKLSDDIAFRFSNSAWSDYPLTADKYVSWLNNIDKKEEIINLFMDYETFGEHQWAGSGIFEFLKALPSVVLQNTDFQFATPTEVAEQHQPVAPMNVPYPISWADEERDLSAWLGNELQKEAFGKLYSLAPQMKRISDPQLLTEWKYLQTSDHFYYMSTKIHADGAVHQYFNPFGSPYDAFINYMNVVSDFTIRVEKAPKSQQPDLRLLNLDLLRDTDVAMKVEKGDEKIPEKISLNVYGDMTVKLFKNKFKKQIGASVKVLKGTKSEKYADDDVFLSELTKSKKSFSDLGDFEYTNEMTVKEFEEAFAKQFKIVIHLEDKKGKKRLAEGTVIGEI